MMPPLWLTLRIKSKNEGRINLYIPLFLIWLILLPLGLLILPFVILYALLISIVTQRRISLSLISNFYLFLCASRGATIEVQEKSQHVYIAIK